MKFIIGDFVVVLDAAVKGRVSKIKANTVFIIDDTGMEFSYLDTELVKVDDNQHQLTKYNELNNHLLQHKISEVKAPKKTVFKKAKNEIVFEVDLHINQLVKTTRGLDNYDMLNLQIDTAKRKLEYAIQQRISKIVFIHGVGAGVLKSELKFLLNKYPVNYYDASYQQYGLGATEVYIFQNPN
ncbi:MAG: DNA mismatch repair protein MutS [Polaribacter sp.]|nr:DNA mismatch repair protein MutS [Polaribacter sp.]MDG1812318.1 DNA mismatch repair protein MutS [Polaribacter sp.]MDG1993199.1 DNA mismatch repair protein MutS [Polaribacter sp.]